MAACGLLPNCNISHFTCKPGLRRNPARHGSVAAPGPVHGQVAAHGRIDVLVNNADIFKAADFLDISDDDFNAVLRINLKGSFLVGQAVARAMSKAEVREGIGGSPSRGSIINMSSVNAAAPLLPAT